MTFQNLKVAAIGECMIELSQSDADTSSPARAATMRFGGDTLNTSVYLSRMGVNVSYVTALGDDVYSDWMLSCWRNEGINCELVRIEPGRVPGLYMIQVDPSGERRFNYWRDRSPARELFEDAASADRLFRQLEGFQLLYLSGISLSLYSQVARERLFTFLGDYRRNGGRVAFDGNYRPAGWPDIEQARRTFESAWSLTDIALPTLEDEVAMFGDESPEAIVRRLRRCGVSEVVVKRGGLDCICVNGENMMSVPANPVPVVVDTTAAGDSFNAGFLGARLAGQSIEQAATWGHALASRVIQHRGAIIPGEAMPDLDSAAGNR